MQRFPKPDVTVDHSHINSILVIKLRAIGDVLLSTVVLPNLRRAFPNARIDFLTEKPSRDVLAGNPDISEAIIFDPKRQSGLSLIRDVRRRKYDCVIDLFGNPRSAIVTLLSGAKYRVGYRFGWRQHCYNVVVEPRGGEVHNTEFNLDALRAVAVPIVGTSVSFPIIPDDEQFAWTFFTELGLNRKFVVALNPSGGWYTKRWRVQQFAELGDLLSEKYQAKIILIWGPGEEPDATEIKQRMQHEAILIPPTTLKQLGAILQECSAMVTNDSGPMHIAAALGTPVVAIYGPTNPKLQSPVGGKHVIVQKESLSCLGCNLTKCRIGNPCMEDLTVDEVAAAFDQLIQKNSLIVPSLQTT